MRNDIYTLLRDRLFLLEDIKIECKLFLVDRTEYDVKVLNKIQIHDTKKIVNQFCKFIKEGIPVKNWKHQILEWNEKEELPFGVIMQSLRLAIVGNLSGPDIFSICEILGNEISLRRLENFYNHKH